MRLGLANRQTKMLTVLDKLIDIGPSMMFEYTAKTSGVYDLHVSTQAPETTGNYQVVVRRK